MGWTIGRARRGPWPRLEALHVEREPLADHAAGRYGAQDVSNAPGGQSRDRLAPIEAAVVPVQFREREDIQSVLLRRELRLVQGDRKRLWHVRAGIGVVERHAARRVQHLRAVV